MGGCNRDLFETCLELCLVLTLKPESVIIIDNATFHKSEYIPQLVAEAQYELGYLPPSIHPTYSNSQLGKI